MKCTNTSMAEAIEELKASYTGKETSSVSATPLSKALFDIGNKYQKKVDSYIPGELESMEAEISIENKKKSIDINDYPTLAKLPAYDPTKPTYTFAAIGTRGEQTPIPEDIQKDMVRVVNELTSRDGKEDFIMNSGAASGTDTIMESGVQNDNKQIFLPYKGFNGNESDLVFDTMPEKDTAIDVMKEVHLKPEKLTGNPRKLQGRNTFQIMGKDLKTPVDFVLAYTPDGVTSQETRTQETGGTGQAIGIASIKGIPIINMANENWETELKKVIEDADKAGSKRIKKPTTPVSDQNQEVIDENKSSEPQVETDKKEASIGQMIKYDGQFYFVRSINDKNYITTLMKTGDNKLINKNNDITVYDKLKQVKHNNMIFFKSKKGQLYTVAGPVASDSVAGKAVTKLFDEQGKKQDIKLSKDDQIIYDKLLNTNIDKIDKKRIAPWNAIKDGIWSQRISPKQLKPMKDVGSDIDYGLNKNFGNPFIVNDSKSNGQASVDYYNWIKNNEIPTGYKKNELNTKRNWIINNLNEVYTSDKIYYSGTAKADPVSHATALIQLSNEQNTKQEPAVKETSTGSKEIKDSKNNTTLSDEDLNNFLADKNLKLKEHKNDNGKKYYIAVDNNGKSKFEVPSIGFYKRFEEYKKDLPFDLQKTSELGSIKENQELYEKMKARLLETYPEIKVNKIDAVYDEYGAEVLGKAIRDMVYYSENSSIDTLPHEYAHVYINLLEDTTYVKNTINLIRKETGVSHKEAKEILVTKMGQYYVELATGNKIGSKYGKLTDRDKSIIKKMWDSIVKLFNILFDNKTVLKIANEKRAQVLSRKFYEGVNASGIRLTPKPGTELIDPAKDLKNQPFPAGILYDIMDSANGNAAFTGSEALAMQGDVYRKQGKNGTDLHDLDFAVKDQKTIDNVIDSLDKKYELYSYYDFFVPSNADFIEKVEELVAKIPSLMVLEPLARKSLKYIKNNHIRTLAVLPKGYKIENIKKFNKTKGKIIYYDVVDEKGKVVGTYAADVVREKGKWNTKIIDERTTGVKAVLVDLIEDSSQRDTEEWTAPDGTVIVISNYEDIFKAKNKLSSFDPRDKDVVDINLFKEENKIEKKTLDDKNKTKTESGVKLSKITQDLIAKAKEGC